MRYIDQTLNPESHDSENIPNIEDVNKENQSDTNKKVKAHLVRRNIEDYLAQKELERSLKDVFDDDFLLD